MKRLTRREALRLTAIALAAGVVAACGPGTKSSPTEAPTTPPVGSSGPAPAPPASTPAASAPAAATPAPGTTVTPNALATKEAQGLNAVGASFARGPLGGGPSVSLTPLKDFYTVAITTKTDWIKPSAYKLSVGGAVDASLEMTLDDIKALPAVEQMRTLECISNPVGGNLISNGMWKGVRLVDVLEKAGLRSQAIEIKLRSADGYLTSIPIALATDADSLLVYEMDGEPLPDEHGAPLRCLFPGRYGMKQPKWIVGIEAVTQPFLGHWESQGWSNDAIVRVNAQIVTPGEGDVIKDDVYPISGTVFASATGIDKLEVSIDSGKTWEDAKLVPGPTRLAWSEWRYDWTTPASGSVTIVARATDGQGNQQPVASGRILLPDSSMDGVWSQHRVPVTIKK